MPEIVTFPLENYNEMRMGILAAVKSEEPFFITEDSIAPFGLTLNSNGSRRSMTVPQEGLLLKTYGSDLFNNWLDTESIDGANGITARSTVPLNASGNGITIDSLLIKRKVYDYLNRIMVAGNTVDDYFEVTYDHKRYSKSEIPVYEGGLSKELAFQEVISQSATIDQPIGTLAGKGVMTGIS